jgi:hypothetical protein
MRLWIRLDATTYDALRRLAEQDLRPLAQEAAFLLREALRSQRMLSEGADAPAAKGAEHARA